MSLSLPFEWQKVKLPSFVNRFIFPIEMWRDNSINILSREIKIGKKLEHEDSIA